MATVRVKIGVAVDGSGNWASIGYKRMEDGELVIAADGLDADARYFWLEADLPMPETETRKAQEVIEVEIAK